MSIDNTQLNVGIGGDIIRTKNVGGVKTEIVQLDLGGESAENLIIAGQKTMVNSVPVVPASDYIPVLQQDLIGNVLHGYPNKSRGFVFGRAPVVNNTRVDLWEGPTPIYVFPNAPMRMQVVSANPNDTLAGTGIQRVHIHYLDTNYAVQSEQISLNGGTVLTVPTNILRINAFHAIQVGSSGTSAGNILLQSVGGAVTYGIIIAGYDTCRQAIYTVPAGVTGYISHWQASSGSAGSHFCQLSLRATTHDGNLWPGVFLVQDEFGTQNGGNSFNFTTPIPIPATTDVKITAISDNPAANVIALGSIMGWFE